MKNTVVIEIICFLLILLFVYAAMSKLLDYKNFVVQLSRSPFTGSFAKPLAVVLPVSELFTAGLLAIDKTRKAALIISFILMLLFTLFILYMLVFEKHLPCSCGGVLKQLTWKQHVWFNIFFTAIAFTGILLEKKIQKYFKIVDQ